MSEAKRDRKTLSGTVVSASMDKTIVVSIESLKKHPRYGKYVKNSVKYKAHDETNDCNVADKVTIIECRPLSKDKNWRLKEVLERAK
ncbi:MAG: 30S ribosomal protein S17 [Proteobacteria bacterium]|nr:30S ribosomal protein S17 [Pseudomonadota bacterium]